MLDDPVSVPTLAPSLTHPTRHATEAHITSLTGPTLLAGRAARPVGAPAAALGFRTPKVASSWRGT
jgi:hypothetical protein